MATESYAYGLPYAYATYGNRGSSSLHTDLPRCCSMAGGDCREGGLHGKYEQTIGMDTFQKVR